MRKMKKLLAATMALTMLVSTTGITACNLGGSRELTSIVIAKGSYDNNYILNETVSFEDIVITAKFNDASTESIDFSKVQVFLDGEDITNNLNKITATVGTKTVVIKYEGKEAKLTIVVSSDVGGGDVVEPVTVVGFEAPTSYTAHLAKKAAAGQTSYTREKGAQKNAYETEFATGNDMFMAGDDNEFKFLPTLRFLNADDQPETVSKFTSATVVSLYNGTEYGVLTSRDKEGEEGIVEYYAEDTVYLTANTENNTYDFADVAIGRQFKLAVLPTGNFEYTGNAVNCEVQVVDGFNVYTAKQLGVIDNDNLADGVAYEIGARAGVWNDIKEAEGLVGINPKAVIIQNDIQVTASDIPADLQYTLNKDITYTYRGSDDEKPATIKGSSTFLYDQYDGSNVILYRTLAANESFTIYGNYFNLDLSQAPLVSSLGTADGNTYEDGYGDDFSNASFLQVQGVGTDEAPAAGGNFVMKNLDVKGNANIDQYAYVNASGNDKQVYAGGLIFVKTGGLNTTIDNVIARTFFIPLMPHGKGEVATYRNVKVYDSYQDAAFIWGKNTVTFESCNFERAGGPLMIAQDIDPDEPTLQNFPTITADENTKLVNMIKGNEFWFTGFNTAAYIQQLTALDDIFTNFFKKITSEEKMNMILVSMPIGSNVNIIGTHEAQVRFSYTQNGTTYELDRTFTSQMGQTVHGVLGQAAAVGANGMAFNAGTSVGYMGTSGAEFIETTNFLTSDYISINFGGFGLFLEFFQQPIPEQP